jgi:hypothetical protein
MNVVHVLKSASNAFCCDLHFQKISGDDPLTPLPKLSVTHFIQNLNPPLHCRLFGVYTLYTPSIIYSWQYEFEDQGLRERSVCVCAF